jgi:peptide/nickel transport system substrate-binding protein/microcin C transport system substrate-binding protein
MRFAKEENVALEMLKKGELDFDPFNAESYVKKAVGPEWGKTLKKEKVQNKAPKGYAFVAWNERKDIFKDAKVRRALAMLMNRKEMNEKFRYGMSLPATGPWYQQSEYADPSVKAIPFDPKGAAALLKQEGWTDSDGDGVLDKEMGGKRVPFSFTLMYPGKDTEKYWTLYQQDLRKAGVQMDIKLLEWNAFVKFLDEGNFDAVALGWGAGSVDLDPKQIWHSESAVKGGSNFIDYKNPAVDKLIDAARGELNKKKRIQILRKVYRQIAEDAPYAFLFNERYALYGHTSRIKMEKPTRTYAIGLSRWWIEE